MPRQCDEKQIKLAMITAKLKMNVDLVKSVAMTIDTKIGTLPRRNKKFMTISIFVRLFQSVVRPSFSRPVEFERIKK